MERCVPRRKWKKLHGAETRRPVVTGPTLLAGRTLVAHMLHVADAIPETQALHLVCDESSPFSQACRVDSFMVWAVITRTVVGVSVE